MPLLTIETSTTSFSRCACPEDDACETCMSQKLFRSSSEALQKLFRSSSEALQKLFRSSSEALQKLFRSSSEALQKL
jgi:hypothetical protein